MPPADPRGPYIAWELGLADEGYVLDEAEGKAGVTPQDEWDALLKELRDVYVQRERPDPPPPERAEIRTRSGDHLDLCDPHPAMIEIEDIAFALSNINRFTGHRGAYSVGQHSLLVLYLTECETKKMKLPREVAAFAGLAALMHDAPEAYLNDVAAPLKQLSCMSGYRDLEAKMLNSIWTAMGFSLDTPPIDPVMIELVDDLVKKADKAAFDIEVAALPVRGKSVGTLLSITKQDPEEIERLFLNAYRHYRDLFGRLTWKGKPNERSPYN